MDLRVVAIFIGITISSLAFGSTDIDCRNANHCIEAGASNGFGKINIKKIEEKRKIDSGYVVREVTLTATAYFPTLIAGKPIIGQYYGRDGLVLFVMAPVSDLDAPSDVSANFVVTILGEEKTLLQYFDGTSLISLGKY